LKTPVAVSQMDLIQPARLCGCVVAYLGLVLMGYLGEKVWIRLNEQHENVTGESLTDRLATDSDGENA